MNGIVRSFNDRGFGFIQPLIGKPDSTPDIYFHISAVVGAAAPPVGCEVSFDLVRGNRGPQGANIRLLKLGGEALQRPTATGRYKFVPGVPDGPPIE